MSRSWALAGGGRKVGYAAIALDMIGKLLPQKQEAFWQHVCKQLILPRVRERSASMIEAKRLYLVYSDFPLGERARRLASQVMRRFGRDVLPRGKELAPPGRNAMTLSDGTVVWFVGSEEEEDELRSLLHEAGHLEQREEGALFDRKRIEEYWRCERDAWKRAFHLAKEFDFSSLLSEKELEERLLECEESEEICFLLAPLCGTDDATKVVSLLFALSWGGAGFPPLSFDKIKEILLSDPERLISFNRCLLRKSWSVTSWGRGKEPLPPLEEEISRKRLFDICSRMAFGEPPPERAFKRVGKEVVWFDVDLFGDIYPFIFACQEKLLLEGEDFPLRATWSVYGEIEGEGPILYLLKTSFESKESYLFCFFHEERRKRKRGRIMEGTLRLFITGFQACCGVYRFPLSDGFRFLLSLFDF